MKEVDTKGVNNNNVYSIEIIYGKPKPIDEVTLQDMQENPIWVFALDEEDSEEIDETWQKPILNYDNVTHELVEAYILMKSTDGQYDISENLDIKKETSTPFLARRHYSVKNPFLSYDCILIVAKSQ